MASGVTRHAVYLAAPLPAIAVGALVARDYGVGFAAFAPNVAAAVLGIALYGFVLRFRRRDPDAPTSTPSPRQTFQPRSGLRPSRGPAPARHSAPLVPRGADWHGRFDDLVFSLLIGAVLLTIFSEGVDGVRRWVSIGPMRLHVMAAITPWILWTASSAGRNRTWGLLLTVFCSILLPLQPDAAQAVALSAGLAPMLLRGSSAQLVVFGVSVASAVWTWRRPDGLEPLDHVEGILLLAARSGPLWLALAFVAFVILLTPMALGVTSRDLRATRLSQSLAAYFVALFVMSFVGAFPVPVFGAGAAHVLGVYAALTVCTLTRSSRPATPAPPAAAPH